MSTEDALKKLREDTEEVMEEYEDIPEKAGALLLSILEKIIRGGKN